MNNWNGKSNCYFLAESFGNKTTAIVINLQNEKYVDTKETYVYFNLSGSNFDNTTSTFEITANNSDTSTGKQQYLVIYKDHLLYFENGNDVDGTLIMTLLEAGSKQPFNISNSSLDTKNLQINIQYSSQALNVNFNSTMTYSYDPPTNWLLMGELVAVAILLMVMVCYASFKIESRDFDHYRRAN